VSDTDLDRNAFLGLSAELTGFPAVRLTGTGMAHDYLDAVCAVVGRSVVADLLDAYLALPAEPADERAAAMRASVLADERLGPVARNVIKLWYVGTWYQLPGSWRQVFGARPRDVTFVVSPMAYTEGLLWPAVDANSPGAKAPGYGTWALPPMLPDIEK